MNAFGKILGYFVKGWYDAIQAYAPRRESSANLLPYYDGGEPLGEETISEENSRRLAMVSAWAWRDIQAIGNKVASALMQADITVGGETAEDHAAVAVLREPNGFMSGKFMFEYLTMWYLLRGNAYAVIVSNGPGLGIDEILPLPSASVRPIPDSARRTADGQLVVDYLYAGPTEVVRIPGEYMFHFRTPNPEDYWQGLSPLVAALNGMRIDYSQAQWVRSFFSDDNAVPANIVSLPPTITEPAYEAIKQQIRREFGGRRRTAVVRAGEISVQLVQQTLEQMQILQSREFSRDEIDRAFGVPKGLFDGALSGDSRREAVSAFLRDTVQPIADHFAYGLTARLRLFYGDDLRVEVPDVGPQDRMLAVQEYRTYSQDRTINENREELGLPPINHPLADVPVRILGILAKQSPQSLAPGFAGVPNPEQRATVEAGKGLDDSAAIAEAWAVELGRWRRVAEKGFRDGRPDAWRQFRAVYLPNDIRAWVADELERAQTADEVKEIFRAALGATGRVLYVRGRGASNNWVDNVRSAVRLTGTN